MRIVIAGAGIVGSTLATQLSREGHDLFIVERNAANAKKLEERLDAMVVHGDGASPSALKRAGIEHADMFIAVTDSDETNILACLLARRFGARLKIARIRSEELVGPNAVLSLQDLGVDKAVNPEHVMVETLIRIFKTPEATDVSEFADGRVLLRGFHIDEHAPIVGKSLAELRDASTLEAFLIAAIARDDQVLIPKGSERIRPGDTVYVLVSEETLPLFLHFVTRTVPKLDRAIVYGAGPSGIEIARRFRESIGHVVVIEPDPERATRAAEELPQGTVLRGDATDRAVLEEAGIAQADAFLALSPDDRTNLLAGLLAKKEGVRRIAVQIQDLAYVPSVHSVGVRIVVNPRLIAVSAILQFVRRGKVWSVFKLAESDAEVLEMEPLPDSKVVGKPLRQIAFPEGAILGAVIQNGFMVIPDGNTVLRAGEHVIVFALPEAIPRLEKLFTKRKH